MTEFDVVGLVEYIQSKVSAHKASAALQRRHGHTGPALEASMQAEALTDVLSQIRRMSK